MTIDEFMRDIAPKMRPGWVAMDEEGDWFYFKLQPKITDYYWIESNKGCYGLWTFDITPVDDWTQSLRKVGK